MTDHSHIPNNPNAQIDASQAIDLHRWAAEIEEFVSEISTELGEIAESLGESNWSATPAASSVERTPKEWVPPTAEQDAQEQSPSDRLQSLKQRLANRNQKPDDPQADVSSPE